MSMMFNNNFQAPVQKPAHGNWLSNDKISILSNAQDAFKLSVSETELLKGQCNHYFSNGSPALVPSADGTGYTCSICGTTFHSHEFTEDDVKNATQNILDILNTIKVMYLSIDSNAALEFFQILPFIEKIPMLYNIAVNDFKRYEGTSINNNNISPFNVLGYMMGMPMMGVGFQQPMYQNQMPGQPMYQPQMPGQPMYNPQMGAPAQPMYQPQPNMATGQPVYTPTPANNPMYGMNTNMPVQPQSAPATTAAPAATPTSTSEEKK